VSATVLDTAYARVGDEVSVRITDVSVPIKIVGVVDYFPTLYEKEAPFIIIGLGPLADYFNARTTRSPMTGNELWVRLTAPGATASDVTTFLKGSGAGYEKVMLASEVVASRLSHPLLAAGWSGLLILTFFIVVLASASGIILYSYLDAREREREFAMLRTLGLSRRQLNGVVWLSVTLILICGIVLGTWAGRQLGTSLLPLLEVAEGGARVTPPMVLHTNWTAIMYYYLVLAAAAAATALALAWLLGRRALHQALRIGE
jgi:ABC-type antimicrobial peptide transport system permease subunit